MKTQVTITKKQENKGARAILDLTSTLGQVLKQFMGIYNTKLPDCDGMTVEDWMDVHGVHRFVGKNGKKGNYTPALLMAGWHEGMQVMSADGKTVASCVFKNVPAKIMISEPGDPNGVSYRVFTEEEANKVDGKPISRYKLTEIADNRWSVSTILRGLKQTRNFAKENDKSVESELSWEAIEKVFIVRYEKNDSGENVRKVVEVDKNNVVF